MRLTLYCVSLCAIGCGDLPPSDDGEAVTTAAGIRESTYTDPESGVVYDLNQNRRVVLGEGAVVGTQPRPAAGDVTEVQSAVSATGENTDWSGQIRTQVVECIGRGPVTGHISIGCSVSPDYVLVGGGAQDVWTGPGALLWESRPQDVDNLGTGRTWLASSKDHVSPANHTLHAWAVGLKIKRTDGTFMTHDELKRRISYTRVTSPEGQHPSISCVVPPLQIRVGGGARSNWPATGGGGQLLTESLPTDLGWRAASKDHLVADPASLDVTCIGIDQSIAGVGSVGTKFAQTGEGAPSGAASSSAGLNFGKRAAVTCYGGSTSGTFNGPGRLLFRMSPADGDIRTATASSKDHFQVDPGRIDAAITGIELL